MKRLSSVSNLEHSHLIDCMRQLHLQALQKYCGQKPTFQGVFWNVSLSPLFPTINGVVQMMSDIQANFLWDTTLIQGGGGGGEGVLRDKISLKMGFDHNFLPWL